MRQYFATVARGLEPIAAQEIRDLGGQSVEPGFAGVSFQGDRQLLYRVNLWGRTLFRVLEPLAEFPCRDAAALYRGVQAVDWADYLTPDQTLAVRATGSNRALNHSHFTALQVKNAVVDQQRDRFGKRSSVDAERPDLWLNLHIYGDRATLSRDSSGTSLHRRGYRPAVGPAPLKESLAAALLVLAEWQPEIPLLDPLCGSGTVPLEAALRSLRIAPGMLRAEFAFEYWPDFDAELWQRLQQEAVQQELSDLPAPIWGRDHDAAVLAQAQANAERCGVGDRLSFTIGDLEDLTAPADQGILICNPPYGKRLGEVEALIPFYRRLGDIFKQRFQGWTAYILSGSPELSKQVGLRASRRFEVYNGSLPCRFLKFELY
ncbi:MAG: RNA methyltransferase [Spirulinaceae cyanobacterium SM2_1_0]|nr:RNA methyltransferase [Spirulinaceae cyanobacterium SM2_1_0]